MIDPQLKQYTSQKGAAVVDAINSGLTYVEAAKSLQLSIGQVNGILYRMRAKARTDGYKPPRFNGNVEVNQPDMADLPTGNKIKRYILTSAQNNTELNEKVWNNLLALSVHYDAEILISQFTYVKNPLSKQATVADRVKSKEDANLSNAMAYDPKLMPYFHNTAVKLAPDLIFCGELNIIPTAVNPFHGLEAYTGQSSAVIPHAKLGMRSLPTLKGQGPRFLYSTGCVTKINYIHQKAGLKASFHHTYGAMLVEVNSNGEWYARQLNADNNSDIYDLEVVVRDGVVQKNEYGIEALNPGDIHEVSLPPESYEVLWGKDGICEKLRPRYQFIHDLVDFRARNHHDTKNAHINFKKYIEGTDNVEDELRSAGNFLSSIERDWCQTVVVDSNHDQAVSRWLREADFKIDPVNALFYIECTRAVYRAIRDRDENFHLVEWVLKELLESSRNTRFLRQDESFIICKDTCGGIESGMHGDLGPNGSRGSAMSLRKLGMKCNVGHYHSCGIHDGLYAAGMSGNLHPEYAKGPSSWSASHIITYENGKRQIITQRGTAWHLPLPKLGK